MDSAVDGGSRRLSRVRRALMVLAVAAVGVGIGLWSRSQQPRGARPSVAVLGFEDLSQRPDSEWLAAALSETLAIELAAGGQVRVIPSESVARLAPELSELGGDRGAGDLYRRIGRNLNADFLIQGSYRVEESGGESRVRLALRLLETERGETLASLSQVGSEARLFDLVSAVEGPLRERLDVAGITDAEKAAVRATLPASTAAFRLYLEGLERLRSYDALAARDALESAIEIDPDYALAHAVLSRALSALGYDQEAERQAQRASDLAGGLPTEETLWIEARRHETAADWQSAIETHQELWRSYADSLDYGLRLAEAQVAAARGRDALRTVSELRALPAPASDDARIDLAEAAAAGSLSDYEAQLAAAERAARKGQARGASIVMAEARRLQGEALWQLSGKVEEAATAFEEARRLFTEAGDRGKVAQVLHYIAHLRYYNQDIAGAEALYQQALAIHQETGNRKGVSETQNSLAFHLYNRGELTRARAMLEEAVAVGREIGARQREAEYLDTLVEVLVRQGDVRAAEELAEELRAMYRATGGKESLGWSLFYLGRVALAAGDVDEARRFLEEALAISNEHGFEYMSGFVLDALANVLLAADDLAGAQRMFEDSRRIRAGGRETLAESRVTGARIQLELGKPEVAEELARTAAETFAAVARLDDEAYAALVQSSALLEQGRLAAARETVRRAGAQAAESENPTVRLSAAVVSARLLAAAERADAAVSELEGVVAEATRLGLLGLAFEARFEAAELRAARRATRESGHADLQALAAEAGRKGCDLIARKASAAIAEGREERS